MQLYKYITLILLYSCASLVRLYSLGRVYTSILLAWHCLHGSALTGGGFGVVRRRSTSPHDIVQCPKEEARMKSAIIRYNRYFIFV